MERIQNMARYIQMQRKQNMKETMQKMNQNIEMKIRPKRGITMLETMEMKIQKYMERLTRKFKLTSKLSLVKTMKMKRTWQKRKEKMKITHISSLNIV